MKAARFHGQRELAIKEVPEPELRPGVVKVAGAWCDICGTHLHEFLEGPIFIPPSGHSHPLTGTASPVTVGHEFSDTIEQVGKGSLDFQEATTSLWSRTSSVTNAVPAVPTTTTFAPAWVSSGWLGAAVA